jgi:hypothetical protein
MGAGGSEEKWEEGEEDRGKKLGMACGSFT